MESTLQDLLNDFIVYKRSLGYLYNAQEYYLRNFEKFAVAHYPGEILTERSVREYIQTLESDSTVLNTVTFLRDFGKYLNKRGIDAFIYSDKLGQPSHRDPYLFTQEEISAFFKAADSITPNPEFVGREILLPAFYRMMYCCGLRTKEARILKRENIDLTSGIIIVLNSKGPKSRQIFISDDLRDYLHKYDAKMSMIHPTRIYFFPGRKTGEPLSSVSISKNFREIWIKAFPDFKGATFPRAYDFRHHFACYNINKWAVEGINTKAMIPYLSKYMGHSSINETLYYFHFTPDFFPSYLEISKGTEDILPEVPYEEE